jgi:hypothetical protein
MGSGSGRLLLSGSSHTNVKADIFNDGNHLLITDAVMFI